MRYSAREGDQMLELTTQVSRGVMFIRIEGTIDKNNFYKVDDIINYLLYSQGILVYVFNLEEVNSVDINLINILQNKLTEIFLSCGSVGICGIGEKLKKKLGSRKDRLFYLKEEKEVFQYISI